MFTTSLKAKQIILPTKVPRITHMWTSENCLSPLKALPCPASGMGEERCAITMHAMQYRATRTPVKPYKTILAHGQVICPTNPDTVPCCDVVALRSRLSRSRLLGWLGHNMIPWSWQAGNLVAASFLGNLGHSCLAARLQQVFLVVFVIASWQPGCGHFDQPAKFHA